MGPDYVDITQVWSNQNISWEFLSLWRPSWEEAKQGAVDAMMPVFYRKQGEE